MKKRLLVLVVGAFALAGCNYQPNIIPIPNSPAYCWGACGPTAV